MREDQVQAGAVPHHEPDVSLCCDADGLHRILDPVQRGDESRGQLVGGAGGSCGEEGLAVEVMPVGRGCAHPNPAGNSGNRESPRAVLGDKFDGGVHQRRLQVAVVVGHDPMLRVSYTGVVEIKGSVVVVTGASSGIGEAIARHLHSRGATVVLGARRQDRLDVLVSTLGGRSVAQVTDVRNREDVAALVALGHEQGGHLDAIVNNAGVGPIGPLDELATDDWEAMVDVNLKGVLWGIAAALPIFREQGSGHIVTIGSTAGYKTVPLQAVYSATKTAVRALMDGLRQEIGPDLRATLISPGATRTDFGADASPAVQAAMQKYAEMGMNPDAVARAVAYALEQPTNIDVGEIVIRSTAQA